MLVWWALNGVKNSEEPAAFLLRVAVSIILEIHVLNHFTHCEKNSDIAKFIGSVYNKIRSNITEKELNENKVTTALNCTTFHKDV
jgi:hypothetical protein